MPALALALAASWAPASAQVAPPHLDILTAEIREVPPIDPNGVGLRTISIELTLAGPPACTSASSFIAYGVLIDADGDPLTGITDPAFDPLGVDARLVAQCDPSTSQFLSEVGPVSVGPPGAAGEVLLTITTVVASLPAVEFDWIAFAIEDASFTRLPSSPGLADWAIFEQRIP